MKFKKLFQMQKVLRDRINYNEPDRLEKLVLALLVELGECANEWRGFKFWSKNQLPRTTSVKVPAMMEEDKEYYNPLLEEYVDGFHFVLELGLERDFVHVVYDLKPIKEETITGQFIYLTKTINDFYDYHSIPAYLEIVEAYIGLGEMLGFTWEQIEQAYMNKNAINHVRQNLGY